MKIVIEPIRLEHSDAFHRAVDRVARERRFLAAFASPPLAAAQSFVSSNIAKRNPHFVALEGEQVVGWCDIVASEKDAHRHCGTLGMGVLPSYRGQGIGQRLLEAAIAAAWSAGLLRIELSVYDNNAPAKYLYEKLGFRAEGCLRAAAKLDDGFVDVIPMALLAPPVVIGGSG